MTFCHFLGNLIKMANKNREKRLSKNKKILQQDLENPTKEVILDLLKAGAVITAAFLFPKAAGTLGNFFSKKEEHEPWEKFNRRRLRQEVKRLVKRKLLSIEEKNNQSIVTLTENGKKEILKYNLKKLKIVKPEKWDGKWRVVIFDVNEKKHHLRDLLRKKMKILGFFPIQKSVFVHPYPCKKEIAFLRQIYKVGNEVSIFTAVDLEESEYLKRHYKLS